jgi:hypothetical protein
MNITTTSLTHLGLISGTFDEVDIADLIDISTLCQKAEITIYPIPQ